MNRGSTGLVCGIARHGEALIRLSQARLELLLFGWDSTLRRAQGRSRSVAGVEKETREDRARQVERALHRTSRLVPGATCIHRSLAGQRMLLRRGMAARIAIGLRRGDQAVEGHAWLEAGEKGSEIRLFLGESAGYRPIL